MIYLITGFIISGIVTYLFIKTAKEVDVKMKEDIKAAENEPSFYERVQSLKWANKVINSCFQIESE